MPDITMCATEGCPLADRCYRKTATPSDWQAYAVFGWRTVDGKAECEWFEPTNEGLVKEK